LPPPAASLLATQPPYRLAKPPFGRAGELKELEHLLDPAATQAPDPVALTGRTGVGKSYLAAAFAQQQRRYFSGGIFWIRAASAAEIAAQVASCGGPGGLDLPGWAALDFTGRVEAVYAAWQQPTPRLLVLEDLQDTALLARWWPQGGGCRVLITTRTWPA